MKDESFCVMSNNQCVFSGHELVVIPIKNTPFFGILVFEGLLLSFTIILVYYCNSYLLKERKK
jgi:hypothetical protein